MGGAKLALTSFSESPLHLLTMEDAEMLKKVVLHSVATALASRVFPVPGGRGGEESEKEREKCGGGMLKKGKGLTRRTIEKQTLPWRENAFE